MNALQSYSSDENSDNESPQKHGSRGGGTGDHGTNYDDVGMDISEDESAGDDGSRGLTASATENTSGSRQERHRRPSGRSTPPDTCKNTEYDNDRDRPSKKNDKDRDYKSNNYNNGSKESAMPHERRNNSSNGANKRTEAGQDKHACTEDSAKKEEKQYSSLQERLLGLASGKLSDSSSSETAHGGSPPAKRRATERRSKSPSRHSGSSRYKSSRRSRSPGHRKRSRSRDRRSRSRDKRSRSRDKKSKSRDRKSRSRSRDRKDRRRRSRSRDRRRDPKKESISGDATAATAAPKPGLLPLPIPSGALSHPPPLLATPNIPPLPSYYNPGSVNALKYAEQERKKKLLWGAKAGDSSGKGSASGVGSIAGLVATPSLCGAGGIKIPPVPLLTSLPPLMSQQPPSLLALARNNPSGRQLNLGLGKNQFSVGGGSKTVARELNASLGRPLPSGLLGIPPHKPISSSSSSCGGGGGGPSSASNPGGMTDLWATTTFNNDNDGKMAEKFKRLMGVKHAAGSAPSSSIECMPTSGDKLVERQEDLFNNMERQYEVARLATHTQRGFGLGFGSSAYLPK